MFADPQRRPGYRRRFRTMDRERFHLSWEQRPPAPDRTRDLPDLVSGILQSAGCKQDLQHQQILDVWPAVVGPDLARRARPGPLENRTLTVYVTSSAWLHELARFGQRELLGKLQRRLPKLQIRRLRFQLDPDLQR